eukprot:PhF_6_TR13669/c0_g1_i3/m.21963
MEAGSFLSGPSSEGGAPTGAVGFGSLTSAFVLDLTSVCERINVRVQDLLETLQTKSSKDFAVHVHAVSNQNPKSPSYGKRKAMLSLTVLGEGGFPPGFEILSPHAILRGVVVPIHRSAEHETTLDVTHLGDLQEGHGEVDAKTLFTLHRDNRAEAAESSWFGSKRRTIEETAVKVRCEISRGEQTQEGPSSNGNNNSMGTQPDSPTRLANRLSIDSSVFGLLNDDEQSSEGETPRSSRLRHVVPGHKQAFVICDPSLPHSLLAVPPSPKKIRQAQSSWGGDGSEGGPPTKLRSRFDINQVRDVTLIEEDDAVTVMVEFDRPPMLWAVVALCAVTYGLFWAALHDLSTIIPSDGKTNETSVPTSTPVPSTTVTPTPTPTSFSTSDYISHGAIFMTFFRACLFALILQVFFVFGVQIPMRSASRVLLPITRTKAARP